MKLLPVILAVFAVNYCASQKQTLKDFFGEWHTLTEIDGKEVIFMPCDAGPEGLIIKESEIIQLFGHDIIPYSIENYRIKDNVLKVIVRYDKVDSILTIKKIDPKTLLFGKDKMGLKTHYDKFEQPCEECWDDCED